MHEFVPTRTPPPREGDPLCTISFRREPQATGILHFFCKIGVIMTLIVPIKLSRLKISGIGAGLKSGLATRHPMPYLISIGPRLINRSMLESANQRQSTKQQDCDAYLRIEIPDIKDDDDHYVRRHRDSWRRPSGGFYDLQPLLRWNLITQSGTSILERSRRAKGWRGAAHASH